MGSLLFTARAEGRWPYLLAAAQAHIATLSIAAVTLGAFLLRLNGLASKSVWYDEAFVVALARMSLPDMVRGLIELDPHPPLYYTFMHFWLLLGTDPFTLRLPSAVFSTLSIPLLYQIGARLVGRKVGLGAAVLVAVSSFHVQWAQEARMYALLGLLCLGSLFFLLRALDHGGLGNWAAHSVLTAACMYTQLNAVFFLAAQALGVVTLIATGQCDKSKLRPWFSSQAVAAALFLPWLPAFVAQNETYREPNLAWTSVRGVEGVLFQHAYGQLPYWRITMRLAVELKDLLVVGALAVSVLGAWMLRRGGRGTLLLWLSLGTVGLLAAMGCWKGILLGKTIIAASFAWFILIVAGLGALKRQEVVAVGLAALLLLNCLGLAKYYVAGSEEDWKAAAGYLSSQVKPGEVAFVDCSAGLLPLDYQLEGRKERFELHGVPFKPWAVEPPVLTEEDYRQVDQVASGRSG
ncbi:MAG TPA: glycosyltransferase family 39 protein, partial [Chloroflexota bacterium]|nr:glycosyltransferase family 39 protein [Chloroflexota bacterium]